MEIEPQEVETIEEPEEVIEETPDEPEEEPEETTEEPPKPEKKKETPEQKKARLTRELKQLDKKLGIKETKPTEATGGLDETQLEYLDLKGYSDEAEIELIEKVMAKTGQTVRETLKDEYVTGRIEAMRAKKAVEEATPRSTKRSGAQASTLEQDIAKFEKDGTLPDDFKRRSAVTNALIERGNSNKPSWHK